MKHNLVPEISVYDLEDKLKEQFPEHDWSELTPELFGEDFQNDCLKRFYFHTYELYEGKPWQNEEHIRYVNRIKSVLQYCFPDYPYVVIDISW